MNYTVGLWTRLSIFFLWYLVATASLANDIGVPQQGEDTPRLAIMSAFEPELVRLRSEVQGSQTINIKGTTFITGELHGQQVVLFLSGVSMVNAAMTTQLALDHFNITHIVFSGIAGGVNPDLNIGDVTVAQRWGPYLELVLARETSDGGYAPPTGKQGLGMPNFGMLFPRSVQVRSPEATEIHRRFWFDADPEMLAVAESLNDVDLIACDDQQRCLSHPPRLVIGGNGVSGSAFVDNAAFRSYAYDTFQANVLDMESAACAQVAYVNGIPFIAFRSLSDLAGGGPGENEMSTFMTIAAENAAEVVLAFLRAWPKRSQP